MDAAGKLQRAGNLRWLRLDTRLDGSGVEYHREAQRLGLRTMSIIALRDLESVGWESAFDRLYALYPTDIWEIGNEISNPDPSVNPVSMTPATYMAKFSALYAHVKNRYPGVTLAIAPVGAPVQQYGEWTYFSGQTAGTHKFSRLLAPGRYEVRAFDEGPAGRSGVKAVATFEVR